MRLPSPSASLALLFGHFPLLACTSPGSQTPLTLHVPSILSSNGEKKKLLHPLIARAITTVLASPIAGVLCHAVLTSGDHAALFGQMHHSL